MESTGWWNPNPKWGGGSRTGGGGVVAPHSQLFRRFTPRQPETYFFVPGETNPKYPTHLYEHAFPKKISYNFPEKLFLGAFPCLLQKVATESWCS